MNIVDNLESKPVQLVTGVTGTLALCEDGSIWEMLRYTDGGCKWRLISRFTQWKPLSVPVSIPVDSGLPELSRYDKAVCAMHRLLFAPVYERHHVASDGHWHVIPIGVEPNWNNPELEFKLGTFEWMSRTWVGHMQGDPAPRLDPGTKVLPLCLDLKRHSEPVEIEHIHWDTPLINQHSAIIAYSVV